MAPIEEFVFHRDERTCYATASTLCGVRGSKLTGVHRVDAAAFPAPSSHIYGLPHAHAQANGALHLVVVHDNGRAISINTWPIGESRRLHQAVNAFNVFLRTYVRTKVMDRGRVCRLNQALM